MSKPWLLISGFALVFGALLQPVAAVPEAQQGSCQFVLGFKTLHDLIPNVVGNCLTEVQYAANGDALQSTTNGQLVWRKADNSTAFTDGYRTWVNGPMSLQERLNTERFAWEVTEPLIRNLTNRQFQVNQGYPKLYQQDDCPVYTYPLTKNCFGNNPAAPYVIPIVKTWPDEYTDPSLAGWGGATEPGHSATYRLDPREAIVIYGELPPPGRYTGLQTWIASREGRWSAEDYDRWAQFPDPPFPIQYLFDTIPPDDPNSGRVQSLSALSNIINNVVIERQSDASFGHTRFFIITPDANMDQVVRGALQELGVSDKYIFTEPIPPSDEFDPLGPFGLGEQAPDFFTAIRYAIPDPGYEEAARAWRANPPLTVLRVRAPSSQGAAQPYPPLTFDPRTAVSEEELASDLQSLVKTVYDRASGAGYSVSGGCVEPPSDESILKDLVRDLGWTGPYCRSIGMNCLGDQQDAITSSHRPARSTPERSTPWLAHWQPKQATRRTPPYQLTTRRCSPAPQTSWTPSWKARWPVTRPPSRTTTSSSCTTSPGTALQSRP